MIFGNLRQTYGNRMQSLIIFCYPWQYLVIFDNLLCSLAIFGDLWLSLANFGDRWRSFAIFSDPTDLQFFLAIFKDLK